MLKIDRNSDTPVSAHRLSDIVFCDINGDQSGQGSGVPRALQGGGEEGRGGKLILPRYFWTSIG